MRNKRGDRVFVRVAYAGGIKPPNDLTNADDIMNWLDERGIIAQEWQLVKQMMDDAQNLDGAGDDEE